MLAVNIYIHGIRITIWNERNRLEVYKNDISNSLFQALINNSEGYLLIGLARDY